MLQEIPMMTFRPRSGWIGFGRPTLQAAKKATGENINILHFFLQIPHHVEFSRHEKSVKCYTGGPRIVRILCSQGIVLLRNRTKRGLVLVHKMYF